jgi:hypothetical protein
MFLNLLRYVRAVLWAFIGLGGRSAEAEKRLHKVNPLPLVLIALVLALLLVVGLMALAHYAASA